ncbi:hypothetical protein NE237_031074 [Protea cynaroides]|uniref:Uncharacterized protein n=1 Tax=Protea cynaroides TaxID=273540 RepID=A0A9Q0L0T3_9MAGN|nr:hypothetical protein NE237_031074 [Protea cynaroides]
MIGILKFENHQTQTASIFKRINFKITEMAKSQALLVAALCFSGLIGLAYSYDFLIEGDAYCDTCRAMFPTKVSQPIPNAVVKLICKSRENGTVTYSAETKTDVNGKYTIEVLGDHEEEICETNVPESTVDDCKQVVPGRDYARVVLTHNNGIVSKTRLANSLGFLKKEPLAVCPEILKELGLLPTVKVAP